MANVDGVRQPELRRRVQEDIADPLDDRCLFPLANVHDFEETSIAFPQVQYVAKHVVYELFHLVLRDHRWIRHAERSQENRLDDVEVLDILFFLADDFVDDTEIPVD